MRKGKTGVMVDSPEQAIVILYPSQGQKNADYVFYQKHTLCIVHNVCRKKTEQINGSLKYHLSFYLIFPSRFASRSVSSSRVSTSSNPLSQNRLSEISIPSLPKMFFGESDSPADRNSLTL
jgi:hypothetical protein